MDLKSILL